MKQNVIKPLEEYVWDGETTFVAYIADTKFENGQDLLENLRDQVDSFKPFCISLKQANL